MRSALTPELLSAVVADTLADGAYIMTEPVADEAATSDEPMVEATVRFSGPRDGRLLLTGSLGFGRVLAANLLGVEPDDPDVADRSLDALGEILNVLSGVLLEAWFGTDVSFESGVPEVRAISSSEASSAREKATCRSSLLADDRYRLDVAVILEGRE